MKAIGEKIKSFTIVDIKTASVKVYNEKGRSKRVTKSFYFLKSDNGQERILDINKKSLTDCETYFTTFGTKRKYKTFSQF